MAMCLKEKGKGEHMDISIARDKHQSILASLMSGPGDSQGAMRRAERAFGLPYWLQVNLRHKRRATAEFIAQVQTAYVAVLERSVKRDLEALKIEQVKYGEETRLANLVAEAEALLAEMEVVRNHDSKVLSSRNRRS